MTVVFMASARLSMFLSSSAPVLDFESVAPAACNLADLVSEIEDEGDA